MRNSLRLFLFSILVFTGISEVAAQIVDNGILINTDLTNIDFTNPDPRVRSVATATLPPLSSGIVAVEFRLKGGDGGTGTWDGIFENLTGQGGQGGFVIITIPVTPANAGQQITFYQGKRGESYSHPISASGGGGGSTAVVDHNGTLLAIAAGGGGGSATETVQSNGLPGGTASNGTNSSCANAGAAGNEQNPNGRISSMFISPVSGYTTFLAYGAGGGGGYFGSPVAENVHAFEISGKSPEFNGNGGIRPAENFLIDNDGCDPLNPFSPTCWEFATQDLSAGGAGYSGGGCGGQYIERSWASLFIQCNNVSVPRDGAGGGGGGYFGGGGGDFGRGGGGGSSYAEPDITNPSFIAGTTTSNPENGFVAYKAIYDTTAPVAVCQNTSVTLGVGNYLADDGSISIGPGTQGQATLNPNAINGGSTDNSFIANFAASETVFNCSDLGVQEVTLIVTDGNSNTNACTAQVTVVDTSPPSISVSTSSIINAPGFGIIDMGANTELTVTPPTNLSFVDNCAVASVTQASPFTVTCADIGSTFYIPVVATDNSGNVKTLFLEYTITSSALNTGTIYVNSDQPNDNGDGSSWATAKKYLSSALAMTDGICNNQREIWVAEGTYYPDEGPDQINNNRQSNFLLRNISIYGGFAGNETSLDQRDPKNHVTILSGDLQQNDNSGIFTDNAYHVLVSYQTSSLALVDGFTIQGGNSNGSFLDLSGGGILNYEGSVTFQNCIFNGNYAVYGGAISNIGPASLKLTNCVVSGNKAEIGGGLYNLLNTTSTITNCTFSGNSAMISGGAIWNDAIAGTVVRNSIIYNNQENGTTTSTGASVLDNGNATTFVKSLVANISATGIVSNEDPLFIQPIDFVVASLPTTTGDFHAGGANIIDSGNNTFNALSKDLDGNARIQSGSIDLGPFETPKFDLFSIAPGNNSNQIPVFSDITFYFSQNIPNYLANRSTILIYGSLSGIINGSFTGGDYVNIIDFVPDNNFQPGEIITIQVSNKLATSPVSHSFSITVPSPGMPANSSSPKIELPPVTGPQRTFPFDLDGDGDLDIVTVSESAQFQNQLAWYENDGNADPGFTLHLIGDLQLSPISGVTFGDLNGDGHLDIIFKRGSIIYIAKSNGEVQPDFVISPIITVQTGSFAEGGVLLIDLDHDGLLDIVTNNSDEEIIWYKNLGGPQPTFSGHPIGYISDYPVVTDIIASDLDSDGDLDLVVTTAKFQIPDIIGYVLWLENVGGTVPGFIKREIYFNFGAFLHADVKDINHDGSPDMIIAGNHVRLFQNNGASPPNFTVQDIQAQAISALSIDVGDMDGDSHPDLLATVQMPNSKNCNWYKNDGMGSPSFSGSLVNNTAPYPSYASLGDLDNDGDLDIILASKSGNSVAWLRTSPVISQFSTSPSNNANDIPVDASIVLTFEEVVTAAFVNSNNIFVHGSQSGVISGSFNGGGTTTVTFNPTADFKPGELVTVTLTSTLGLSESYVFSFTTAVSPESPGTFDNGQSIISTAADGARSVFSADLDGDGDLDVLSASSNDNKIAWYANDGTGSFGSQQVISTQVTNARCVFSADLDGDGDMDVLSASQNDDKIAWYQNDGSGNFGPQLIISTLADGAQSVYATDLDGDGDLDVLSASSSDNKIAWYQNNGSGSFGNQLVISNVANAAYHVYTADLDNDGDMDVLSASNLGDKIVWYENNGSGSFGSEQVISTLADGARWVSTADVDNDGDMDVLSASQTDNKIAWYQNDGSGNFGPQQIISSTANGVVSICMADMDGDDDMDVLSASFSGFQLALHKNDGSGNFGPEEVISNSVLGPLAVFASDLDGDGDLDVLSASSFDDKIAWYENVSDLIPPVAVCQNIVVELDATGQVIIDAEQIDGGSTSAAGIASLTASPNTFDCSHVGLNEVELSVMDIDGIVSTCIASVTVADLVEPTAICQNVNVQLGALGTVSIMPELLDGGSSDACGITSLYIDVNTFTSDNTGANNVVLTVGDLSGNIAQCTAVVTVVECLGDFNNDGTVSTADLIIILAEFGCLSNCLTDLNGDGVSNSGDITLLLSVYGSICD